MHRQKRRRFLRGLPRRVLAIVAMIATLAAVLTLTVFAQNSYVITDGDFVTVHKSYSTDPDVVLDEVGIELSEEDTYTTTFDDGVGHIDIQRMQMVTVIHCGDESVIGTYGETVGALLQRAGIELHEGDVLSCEADSPTHDGMVLEVVNRKTVTEEYDEIIPYQTNYFEDPDLEADTELVLVDGVNGVIHYTAKVVYENGVEISREVVDRQTTTEMVTRLVVRSSDRALREQPDEPEHRVPQQTVSAAGESEEPKQQPAVSTEEISENTITTSTGTSYTYTNVLTVTATAYSCEGYTGYTYSGTVARVGAIAVDPKVIPIGTKMYIVSNDGQYVYGYCVAEDTGGSIIGNRIDLYFDTFAECWDFGVRTCTVYILA